MRITPARITVGFSNLGHAYTHLFLLLFPTVVLALEAEFHRPYGELLSLSLAGFILLGLGAVPAGWLADRWSAKGMLTLFFLGVGGGAIFTGLAAGPFQIGVGLAAIGLFASIYHPVGISLVVKNSLHRGTALGINGIFGNGGTAVAALVAGVLTDLISWRAAFIVPGAVAMVTGVAFFLFARVGHGAEAAPAQAAKADATFSRGVLVRATLVLSVTLLCSGLIYQVTAVALPKIFAQRLDGFGWGGTTAIGGMVSLVYLCSAFSQVGGGWLADRLPPRLVYMGAYLALVPVFLLGSIAAGAPLLLVAVLMVSLNLGAAPVETSMVAHYSPAKWQATAFGAKFAVALGVSAGAIPLVGAIYDGTGEFFWLFVVLACFTGLLVAASLLLPASGDAEARAPAGMTPALAQANGQGD